jgi:THO complex subunit 1 transcription elongation factor
MEFTLEGDAVQWVSETIVRAHEELRQTAPAGRVFADAVVGVLERERNWVRWKNDLCSPFDREPESGSTLEERTRATREEMRAVPEEWPHALGSAPLTEIWEMGYRDLWDIENPFQCVCHSIICWTLLSWFFKARRREGLCKEDQDRGQQD